MSSRKYQKNIEKELIEIVNSRANDNKCGECGSLYPTWASYNLGIFLCGRCASLHRKILGPSNISKVKSLTLDQWSMDEVSNLKRIGNKKAKKKWNPKRVPFPLDDNDDYPIEEFLREKYILGKYRNDSMNNDVYDGGYGRYSEDELLVPSRLRASSRAGRLRLASVLSNSIPKLSHRKLTTFEYTQNQKQLQQLMSYGYTDRDSALESLLLSNGLIELALDILDQDRKINPHQEELPPKLPKRPAPSSAASNITQAEPQYPSTNSDEWWSTSTNNQTTTIGQPQIYQYTNPITGQISYIDSNGQEYLDTNNVDHQKLMYQQTNPQLIQQQTNKQNIMSLYNQPSATSSQSNAQSPITPQPGTQVPQQTAYNFQGSGMMNGQQAFSSNQAMNNPSFQPQFTGFTQFQQPQQGYFPYQQ